MGFNEIVCDAAFEWPDGERVGAEQLDSSRGLETSWIGMVSQHIEIAYRGRWPILITDVIQ